MKTSILKSIFIILVLCLSVVAMADMPGNWFKAGSHPKSYKMGVEEGSKETGKKIATIKSIDKEINGCGTFMQQCLPDNYLGKRVRMSGFVKYENVTDWAGLWLRIDGAEADKVLSFDNMGERPIKGTTDWNKYEIVLDVPLSATMMSFGALLKGTGQIWFDNIKFEVVDNTVEITDKSKNHMPLTEPTNLDFEK